MKKYIVSGFFLSILCSLFSQETGGQFDVQYEEVSSYNGKIKISGTLVLPVTESRCPAIVMIHGSGEATRELEYAARFAREGIAVLTYDKRGCGQSEGKYEGSFNVSKTNLNLLAGDALSMLSVLEKHSRIDPGRIGLWGISQAGWIFPLVAVKAKSVSFIVMLSAPAVNVTEEIKFSSRAENNPEYLKTHTEEEIEKDITGFQLSDIFFFFTGMNMEPKKYLAKIAAPILWLYGEADNSIPVARSIKVINSLNKTNSTIKVYPGHGHGLKAVNIVNNDTIDWILNVIPAEKL